MAFGGLMHAVVGVFVLSSGLVAPPWAVFGLTLLWVAGGWLLWRLRRTPLLPLLVPVATAGLWWVVVALGGQLLGWTA